MSSQQFSFPTNPLRRWFLQQRRDLPWREEISPYAVWVSEVMLQQTQVSVVVPYFLRWMERFPTIEALAAASVEEVIKIWEGLGYYSRARNLHEGARFICEHFSGELPSKEEDLKKIKGLGPYTIGAIRSFAFHEKAAAVDGNVLRVISRFYALRDDIGKQKTVKKIRECVEGFLPEEGHWEVNEALIELGAIICKKKPLCRQCPLKEGCQSFLEGSTDEIPVKAKREKTMNLFRSVPVICSGDAVLIQKVEEKGVMQHLHQFPYFEHEEEGMAQGVLVERIQQAFGLEAVWQEQLSQVQHSFTKYRVTLTPHFFKVKSKVEIPSYFWCPWEKCETLPFSSGHRRILKLFRYKFPCFVMMQSNRNAV